MRNLTICLVMQLFAVVALRTQALAQLSEQETAAMARAARIVMQGGSITREDLPLFMKELTDQDEKCWLSWYKWHAQTSHDKTTTGAYCLAWLTLATAYGLQDEQALAYLWMSFELEGDQQYEAIQRCLRLCQGRRLGSDLHDTELVAIGQLANWRRWNDSPEAAAQEYRRLADMYQEIGNYQRAADALNDVADIVRENNPEAAIVLYEQAIAMIDAHGDEYHYPEGELLPDVRMYSRAKSHAFFYIGLTQVYQLRNDAAGIAAFRQALDMKKIEFRREPWQQHGGSIPLSTARPLIELYLQTGREKEAFGVVEEVKGASLMQMMTSSSAEPASPEAIGLFVDYNDAAGRARLFMTEASRLLTQHVLPQQFDTASVREYSQLEMQANAVHKRALEERMRAHELWERLRVAGPMFTEIGDFTPVKVGALQLSE